MITRLNRLLIGISAAMNFWSGENVSERYSDLRNRVSTGISGTLSTYQAIVRPQLERREQAVIEQRQHQDLQRQVQALRHDFDLNMERNGVATGHPTRFMTYSHYYPRLDQPPPRRR